MTGNRFLLDTNIIIGLFANDHSIIENLKSHSENTLVPSIVLGELFYGAELSSQKDSNKKKIDLARIIPIVGCDTETARLYGVLKSQPKRKGTPIPENDIWIAALSKQHELILISRDNHFTHMKLRLEKW